MIKCKEATYLVVKKEEHNLSLGEWLKLKLHLMLCRFCRAFVRQSSYIAGQAGHVKDSWENDDASLQDAHKAEIKSAMK